MKDAGIRLEATEEFLDYQGEQGYDPQFGARPLKRVLQTRILNKLSKEILAGNIRKHAVVKAVLIDDKIQFVNIDIDIPLDQ